MIVLNVNGKDIPDYAFESRVQELADEMQIHQRKREFARYFAVGSCNSALCGSDWFCIIGLLLGWQKDLQYESYRSNQG